MVEDDRDRPGAPSGWSSDDAGLWVAARDASAAHRGGTLGVAVDDIGTIDQFDYSLLWNLDLTGDGLTAYRRVAGTDGAALVPDLAASIPTPTDDGRTYTFQLRPGVRYSTGETVGPDDFRRGIERYYRLGPAPALYYDVIVGAEACRRRPASCDLSTRDRRRRGGEQRHDPPDPPGPQPDPQPGPPVRPRGGAVGPATEVTRQGLPATGPIWSRATGRDAS